MRSSIFRVPLASIRRHSIRLNQPDGSKYYAPTLTFGRSMRALRLSWKRATDARDYADKVLMRYASLLEVADD